MEKLSMCRICLAEDGLRSIVDTHLQEMYESLVICPLEATDWRPIHACYICCARLQNCYDLRQSCLQSEELFTQMLSRNENQPKLIPLEENANRKRLNVAHPVLLLSVGDVPQVDPAADVGLDLDIKPDKLLVEEIYENVDGGTADRTVEEDNVDYNIQAADSYDDIIITKVEYLEGSTGINMPMKPSLPAERIFSELKETPALTVQVEVEDMKEIEVTESISSSLSSDDEVDIISLGTQQTTRILKTSAHIHSDSMPSIVEPHLDSIAPVAEPQHLRTTVETSPRISARLAAKKRKILSPTITRNSRRPRKRKRRPLQPCKDTDSETETTTCSHNTRERHRRKNLIKLFDNLKQSIPRIRGNSRVSKARILQDATDLCKKFTQQEIEEEKLRIKQKQLATRLKELLKPA